MTGKSEENLLYYFYSFIYGFIPLVLIIGPWILLKIKEMKPGKYDYVLNKPIAIGIFIFTVINLFFLYRFLVYMSYHLHQ